MDKGLGFYKEVEDMFTTQQEKEAMLKSAHADMLHLNSKTLSQLTIFRNDQLCCLHVSQTTANFLYLVLLKHVVPFCMTNTPYSIHCH